MVELADAGGKVAFEAEGLWHAHLRRDCLAEDLPVGEDAGRIGVEAGEKRTAAGATEGKPAVGPIKPHAAGREPVDVGRLCAGVAVAAEEAVEVIRDDEEHVWPAVGRGRVLWQARRHGNQQKQAAAEGVWTHGEPPL